MTRPLPAAVLLAGGLGTRIRAVGGDTPKVLLPVEGRPFLAHLLDYLARQGVTTVVLCTGHAADAVWDAAASNAPEGVRLVESREGEPLGTGGAIKQALPKLDDTFFVVNGDTYFDVPLARLMDSHELNEAQLTLALVRSEAAAEKGTVRMAPNGRILDFAEKVEDGTGLVNGGIYLAEPALFASYPEAAPCSLEREVIPAAVHAGAKVMGMVVEAPFVDIGLPEDYLAVRDRLPRRRGGA
jgi:D-glycero-alpha-D-manno-heptose 1-phosphate guanylyltransferase